MRYQPVLNQRSAGILLHITSLPGPAFIGDIGGTAFSFADFLHSAKQKVWQLLPLQPVTEEQGYSPYSSESAFAGNPLLISPATLVDEGLVDENDIPPAQGNEGQVNFKEAAAFKEKMLHKAFLKWRSSASAEEVREFREFCDRESGWLNDYALYTIIKQENKGSPWYKWHATFRDRNPQSLEQFGNQFQNRIEEIKWIQMTFSRQWTAFRSHCTSRGIRLVGDVPIYVAHDSADVWSHRELFTVDDSGALAEVAGVPPDLFNDEGQLWGMPLYNWHLLNHQNYGWWIRRLQKNLEYFDLVRLDHFRGFSAYWSVPHDSPSAKGGTWKPGPGKQFFEAVRAALGDLPFIAEDLGEIDEPVYELRDALYLPGMNVLQFAFGDDMPESPYLPHHHRPHSLVYTGTHDNNTTTGWYKHLKEEERRNLNNYLGIKTSAKNISHHLCRLAYMSVSNLVILPMQDVLSLDESARMNMPASSSGNWSWRLRNDELTRETEKLLKRWCFFYDRIRE